MAQTDTAPVAFNKPAAHLCDALRYATDEEVAASRERMIEKYRKSTTRKSSRTEEGTEVMAQTETVSVEFNKLERQIVAQALRQVIKEMKDAARYEGERHDLEIRIAESALNKVKGQ